MTHTLNTHSALARRTFAALVICATMLHASAAEPRVAPDAPGAEAATFDEEQLRLLKRAAGDKAEIQKLIAALNAQPLDGADAIATAAQIRAVRLLCANEAVPALARIALKSSDQTIAREAWAALGDCATAADFPTLLPVLEAPRDLSYERLQTQHAAMDALVGIASEPAASALLVQQLSNLRFIGQAIARVRQIELIGRLHTSAANNLLRAYAEDGDPEVKRCAINSIDFVESPLLRDELLRLLGSTDAQLQKAAALALGRSGTSEAVPQLIALIDSPLDGVKDSAAWSLRRLTGRTFGSATAARQWFDSEKLNGEFKFEELKARLASAPPREVPLVIEDLSTLVLLGEKVDALLIPMAEHKDFRVRAAICDSLAQRSVSNQNLRVLITALRDPSDVVSSSAWRALKELTRQQLPKRFEVWQQWLEQHG